MPLRRFASNHTEIAYLDEGAGEPILLIHGFASNHQVNWVHTGWVDALLKAGRRVIAMDVRGHGESSKHRDPEAYRISKMAADAADLLDHLGLDRVDVMGFSMGARIAAFVTVGHPERVRSLVIGGLGMALVEGMGGEDEIVAALEAPEGDVGRLGAGAAYRRFAEQTGSDLLALAACMRVARQSLAPEHLAGVTVPVLIVVGELDEVAGSPEALGALIPGSEVVVIPRRDHMRSTGDKAFVSAALDFLARRP